ncbi:MAG: hypothetical protein AAF915_16180 [Cyanobacteria bacterium P01_D01_bin.50]
MNIDESALVETMKIPFDIQMQEIVLATFAATEPKSILLDRRKKH